MQSPASEHSLAISIKHHVLALKHHLYVPHKVYANRRAAGNTHFKHARMCGSFKVQAVRIYADVLKKHAGLFSSTICLRISLVILDFSRLCFNGDLADSLLSYKRSISNNVFFYKAGLVTVWRYLSIRGNQGLHCLFTEYSIRN